MKRLSKIKLLAGTLGMGLLVVVLLEFAGVVSAKPTPEKLLSGVEDAWNKTSGYRVDISVGRWQAMGDGPLTCREWSESKTDYVRASKDLFGFWHMERWLPSSYRYYQPGADFEAEVSLLHEEEAGFARWMISGFPSLTDLVAVIQDGQDHQVVGSGGSAKDPQWILEFQPSYPADLPEDLHQSRFFAQMFKAKWRVWLSEETGLPSHILVNGVGEDGPLRIGIENLETSVPKLPADWKQVMQLEGSVKRRISMTCDTTSRSSIETTKRRISDEVTAWKKRLYPNFGLQPTGGGVGVRGAGAFHAARRAG